MGTRAGCQVLTKNWFPSRCFAGLRANSCYVWSSSTAKATSPSKARAARDILAWTPQVCTADRVENILLSSALQPLKGLMGTKAAKAGISFSKHPVIAIARRTIARRRPTSKLVQLVSSTSLIPTHKVCLFFLFSFLITISSYYGFSLDFGHHHELKYTRG